MASRRFSRFRYALRLVASVFLLSSPCQGGMGQEESPSVQASPASAPPVAPGERVFADASHPVR